MFCLAVHQVLREVLKITTIIMELSASLFSSVNFSFIYFEAVTGHMHTDDCCLPDELFFYAYKMSVWCINFVLKPVLSNINITIPHF